jgi:glycine oxidase
VETSAGTFRAPVVILATGAWSSLIKYGENAAPLVEVAPVRGQMLSFLSLEKVLTRVVHSGRGYLVPRADNRVLVGATVENAGFEKEVTAKGVESLLKCAYEISPGLKGLEIGEKWAGLRPRAADGLPMIGKYRNINGLYIATAHFRNGILLAPLTANILARQILEGEFSKYLEVFSPNRFVGAVTA